MLKYTIQSNSNLWLSSSECGAKIERSSGLGIFLTTYLWWKSILSRSLYDLPFGRSALKWSTFACKKSDFPCAPLIISKYKMICLYINKKYQANNWIKIKNTIHN